MSCTRIYDFIRGTTIVLPKLAKGDKAPRFDILHPDAEAEALIQAHTERLAGLRPSRDRAETHCER